MQFNKDSQDSPKTIFRKLLAFSTSKEQLSSIRFLEKVKFHVLNSIWKCGDCCHTGMHNVKFTRHQLKTINPIYSSRYQHDYIQLPYLQSYSYFRSFYSPTLSIPLKILVYFHQYPFIHSCFLKMFPLHLPRLTLETHLPQLSMETTVNCHHLFWIS